MAVTQTNVKLFNIDSTSKHHYTISLKKIDDLRAQYALVLPRTILAVLICILQLVKLASFVHRDVGPL